MSDKSKKRKAAERLIFAQLARIQGKPHLELSVQSDKAGDFHVRVKEDKSYKRVS